MKRKKITKKRLNILANSCIELNLMFMGVYSAITIRIQNMVEINANFIARIRCHFIILINFLKCIHMDWRISTAICSWRPRPNSNNIIVIQLRLVALVMLTIDKRTIGSLQQKRLWIIRNFGTILWLCIYAYIFVNNSHGFSLDNYATMRSTAKQWFDSDRSIASSTYGCASGIFQRNSSTPMTDSNEKPSISASTAISTIHVRAALVSEGICFIYSV